MFSWSPASTKMLAKSQPSMVSNARSTTACKVSAALPIEDKERAVSKKLAVSSDVRSLLVVSRAVSSAVRSADVCW
jgi:hypothetical protein